jgi:hypothetical protein
LTKEKVGVKLTLALSMAGYSENLDDKALKALIIANYPYFLNLVKTMLGFPKIIVRGFKKGSIVSNVDVPIPSGQLANNIYNAISNNLVSNKNIPGLSLLSSTVSAKNFTLDTGEVNLGLILGVSIPLVVLRKNIL